MAKGDMLDLGRCPNCPGPKVPHHCGIARAAVAAGKMVGKGHAVSGGMGKGKGKGNGSGTMCGRGDRFCSSNRSPGGNLQEKTFSVLPDIQETGDFSVRGRVLGKGGENLKYITEKTGCRVVLEGMMLRVLGRGGANIEGAAEMVRDLLSCLRKEYDQWRHRHNDARTVCSADSEVPAPPTPHAVPRERRGREGLRPEIRTMTDQLKAEAVRLTDEAQRLKEEGERLRLKVKGNVLQHFAPAVDDSEVRTAAIAARRAAKEAYKERKDVGFVQARALESAMTFWEALEFKREKERAASKVAIAEQVKNATARLRPEKCLWSWLRVLRPQKLHLGKRISS